jgi:superfamily II RNA helicase
MVKVCTDNNYPTEKNAQYSTHFESFSFPLSDFQKHSIEAIVDGHHSLVCCPTGSGKTLSAEFAIRHFTALGKRVIYTSPLKALSNEKYYDFTQKYPGISFGVLTGDIKLNPDAQVLIMTAEILLNTLFGKSAAHDGKIITPLSFEMDFDNELGCVVMDEIHFINDAARGGVWEQTLMLLPHSIQLVMLSATLDSPEKFAGWIESRDSTLGKQVYLSTSSKRMVPLSHYVFLTTNEGLFKTIKRDEALTKEMRDIMNKPLLIQSAAGVFQEPTYHRIKKALTLISQKQIYVKKQHVINEVCRYMFQHNLLPAVLFILSRKQIDVLSKQITANLLEDDSKTPYIVHRECAAVLRKLPNHEEYLQLPEYIQTVALLEKGIGVHHSGVMPVLREITEILFSKGFIKLLLATETFSVGLNMPIKTTVFTGLAKFDGVENRWFHAHEYTQAAGRAGRRGIDTIGTVIHLPNLFRMPEWNEYRTILCGQPQKLTSKFKISYGLVLNLLESGIPDSKTFDSLMPGSGKNLHAFIGKTMANADISCHLAVLQREKEVAQIALTKQEEVIKALRTPMDVLARYVAATTAVKTSVNKKRKELEREIAGIQEEYRSIESDKDQFLLIESKRKALINKQDEYDQMEGAMSLTVQKVKTILKRDGFLEEDGGEQITRKGKIAAQLREVHGLVFGRLIEEKRLSLLSVNQLVSIFSCFTNVVVGDEQRAFVVGGHVDSDVKSLLEEIKGSFDRYQDEEAESGIDTGIEYVMHYDLLGFMGEWLDAESVETCRQVLKKVEEEKGIFLGEFVKAVLKINTVAAEMEKIAEMTGDMVWLKTLKEIPVKTLKYVATNQSLYL